MKHVTLFLLILFLPKFISAQFIIEESLKTILPATSRQTGVVPIGKAGLVIFYEAISPQLYGKRKWEIIQLDTNFESKIQSSFESDIDFYIQQVKYHDGFLYLFFKDSYVPNRSVIFARFNVTDKKIDFFQINSFIPKEVSGFEVLGNSLFLVGMDDERPSIIKYKFGDARPDVLQGLYNENNELLSIELIPELNVIQIITRLTHQKTGRTNKIITVKHFDESGKISKDLVLESAKGYDLMDALTKTDADGNTCVVGTFSYRKSKLSNGIFTKIFEPHGEHPLRYYDYSSLHNYFNFMSNNELEKLRKKHTKTIAKGKNPTYKDNHLNRELIKTGNSWQYLGEVATLYDLKSGFYRHTDLGGFLKYSHAMVLGISGEGKLKWDNIIDMEELNCTSAAQQVHLHSFDDRSMLFYQNVLSLNYKFISEEVDISGISTFDLDATGDLKVNDNYSNNGILNHWYDDKFITFELWSTNSYNKNSGLFLFLNKISPNKNIQGL